MVIIFGIPNPWAGTRSSHFRCGSQGNLLFRRIAGTQNSHFRYVLSTAGCQHPFRTAGYGRANSCFGRARFSTERKCMSAWTAADAPSQIVTLPQRDSNLCVGLLESLVCVLWSIFKTFLIHKNIVYHQTPDRPPSGHLLVYV